MSRIVVENLGKKYKHFATRWGRLLETLSGQRLVCHQPNWALRGVTFQVAAGESIGFIGQNGAGKSTLLKILTGTTRATEGTAHCEGRMSALLELGMGFHPEFSGRQNAVMGCQMMGIAGGVIAEVLPSIIEFSELADSIDEPFRTYSTGMQMRLAFSVATAVRPEILIVDEALSVGDAYFQHKSIQRIREFRTQGTTLLFVSHDPGAVKTLCDRAILLDQGVLVREGTPEAVLDYYNAIIAKQTKDLEIKQIEDQHGRIVTRSGNRQAQIESVEFLDRHGHPARATRVGDHAQIACRVRFAARVEEPTVGMLIRDRLGNEVFGINTFHLKQPWTAAAPGDVFEVRFGLELNLGPGQYSLTMAVHTGPDHLANNFDWWDNLLAFQVIPGSGPIFSGIARLQISGSSVALVEADLGVPPKHEPPQAGGAGPTNKDSREAAGLVCDLMVSLECARVEEGSLVHGTVRVWNTSDRVWLPSPTDPGGVLLGCHLLSEDQRTIDHDFCRTALGDMGLPIEPGEEIENSFQIPAPAPGKYVLEFDLVSEEVCWFAANGSHTVRIRIEVERSKEEAATIGDSVVSGQRI